jgi:hypothetical protein
VVYSLKVQNIHFQKHRDHPQLLSLSVGRNFPSTTGIGERWRHRVLCRLRSSSQLADNESAILEVVGTKHARVVQKSALKRNERVPAELQVMKQSLHCSNHLDANAR